MSLNSAELAAVFIETIYMVNQNPKLKLLSEDSVKNTVVFNDCSKVKTDKYCKKSKGINVSVISETSFDTARALIKKYSGNKKVAVLNFANAYNPGGGVIGGARLEKGSWNDEFRASYMAAKNCPHLTNEDRRYLVLDALERAKEQDVSIIYNNFIRRVLYG